MPLDFRLVELRWRGLACAVVAVLLGSLLLMAIVMMRNNGLEIDESIGAAFGLQPSLALCNRPEHPVRFLNYSISFSHSEYEDVQKTPNYAVQQFVETNMSNRRCVHFISSEPTLDLDVEFKVSFTESFDAAEPRQFEDIFSDLILNAHAPGSDHSEIGPYAGNMGILESYAAVPDPDPARRGSPRMTAFRVEKMQYITADWATSKFTKYVAKDVRFYNSWKPSLPQMPLQLPEGEAPPLDDPKLAKVRVVHWDIFVPLPRLVITHREIPESEQFVRKLAKLGGSITVLAAFFGLLFPRMYPQSETAAVVDMRTLRCCQVQDLQPRVDPVRERLGDCRCWPPAPEGQGVEMQSWESRA